MVEMLRLIIYLIFISIIIFIPFEFTSHDDNVVRVYKNSSINISLVEPIKPQIEPLKSEPVVKKPSPKPKPKKITTKVVKKIIEPIPAKKQEPQPEPEQKERVQEVFTSQAANKTAKSNPNPNIKESYYQNIYNQIDAQKRYPKQALRFKQEGDVKISFVVLADGSVVGFKITEPSEFESLNQEIKNVFKKLKKFAKPPSEIETPLEVSITIRFKIQE